MELPFTTDYARSNKAICRGCQKPIMKNTLRLAIMLQCSAFDGKVPNWYHTPCFFIEHMPTSKNDIQNITKLRSEDQEKITSIINKGSCSYDEDTAKNLVKAEASKATAEFYSISYCNRAGNSCQICSDPLIKDDIMITDAKTKSKKIRYHLNCFSEFRSDIGYLEAAEELSGFQKLNPDDQQNVQQLITTLASEFLPPRKQEKTVTSVSPPKKQKLDDDVILILSDDEDDIIKETCKDDDNNLMHEYRNELKKLTNEQLKALLKYNKQKVPRGNDAILDKASEMLTFGALSKCPLCRRGDMVPINSGYQCTGQRNNWSSCTNIVKDPIRTPVRIPETLMIMFNFLMVYEFVPRQRELLEPSPTYQKNEPFKYLNFAVIGFPPEEESQICKQIKYLGGHIVSHIKRSVLAVITKKEEFQRHGALLRDAQTCGVYIVPKDFISAMANVRDKDTVLEKIRTYDISDWGTEVHMRIPEQFKRNINRPKFRRGEEEEENRRKIVVKRGLAIEPDAELDEEAHVYQIDNNRYTAVLSKTDVTTNKNSYYKIQLLESDTENMYWIFRSWGRVGTEVGGFKKVKQPHLETAIQEFERLFHEKTGYDWRERRYASQMKKHGKFAYVEVDYQASKEELDLDSYIAETSLQPTVAHLISFIFNIHNMEKVLLEYSLDTQKLPLGKLSKSQVNQAYKVLTEALAVLKCSKSINSNDSAIVECTNRFYSLMPHSSALRAPPLLNNYDTINKKLEMLETLFEMETAYSMIQRKASGEESNPLDAYYKQLCTDIDVLDKNTEEYPIIEQYVVNTHGDTHRHYNLQILEVFKINRHEEPKRYSKYNSLHNRKLLWHGSRSTNFAGILCQGLRIAPPEAPASGYMFGKGIYFADIVSKSANYCCVTDATSNEGLLLLCEVALGNIQEKFRDDCSLTAKKLPKDKHSVKGVGKTQPDDGSTVLLSDGVEVPVGKPVTNLDVQTPLLYNEYIVYDVAQVKARYLLKIKFIFRH